MASSTSSRLCARRMSTAYLSSFWSCWTWKMESWANRINSNERTRTNGCMHRRHCILFGKGRRWKSGLGKLSLFGTRRRRDGCGIAAGGGGMRLDCTHIGLPDADGHETRERAAPMHFCSFCRKRSSKEATKREMEEGAKRRVSRTARAPGGSSLQVRRSAPHAYLAFRNAMRSGFSILLPSLPLVAARRSSRRRWASCTRLFALARQAGRSLARSHQNDE